MAKQERRSEQEVLERAKIIRPETRRMTEAEWNDDGISLAFARDSVNLMPSKYLQGIGMPNPKIIGKSAAEEKYPSELSDQK